MWFVGGSLIASLFLAIFATYGYAPPRLIVLCAFALDGPHVYSTATRVLFDPVERHRTGKLWLCLLVLPIFIASSVLLFVPRPISILVLTWGHYHIFKQHMGFVFLFKRKAREVSDFSLDKYFTLGSMFLPYVYFVIAYVTGHQAWLPPFAIAGFILAAYFAWHQMQLPQRNVPKLLLLAVFIPLHWVAFVWAAEDPGGRLMALVAVTNIGHSFQYLRLMWFHNNNRYSQHSGFLGLISRKWLYFLAVAFLLSFPIRVLPTTVPLMLTIPFTLVIFHYIVDARIWRVRGDKELAAALRLSA